MIDYKKLKKDMAIAALTALQHKDDDDGGTCNFDTPVIILKGARKETVEALLGETYGCYKWSSGEFHVGHKFLYGQGNRRTAMAEAFAKSLEDNGWFAYVYYQMD